jgi:hypothetical protein
MILYEPSVDLQNYIYSTIGLDLGLHEGLDPPAFDAIRNHSRGWIVEFF